MAIRQAILVYKKSQLQLALENKNARIKRLLQQRDPSVARMREAHDAHTTTRTLVEKTLADAGFEVRRVYRARLRAPMTRGRLVVCLGGDGTLLDASHKVGTSPVLGVNSDTANSVGFLCAAHQGNFAALLDEILSGALAPTRVARLSARIGRVKLPPVLNDVLVAHKNPAATSRVLVEHRGVVEDQKSSGVWASTAAGSTAAMASAGGTILELDDATLQVRTREPFVADGPGYRLAHLLLPAGDAVRITSKMREGRVYLDGPHETHDLPMGACLTLSADAPPLALFATEAMRVRRAHARATTERARAAPAATPSK